MDPSVIWAIWANPIWKAHFANSAAPFEPLSIAPVLQDIHLTATRATSSHSIHWSQCRISGRRGWISAGLSMPAWFATTRSARSSSNMSLNGMTTLETQRPLARKLAKVNQNWLVLFTLCSQALRYIIRNTTLPQRVRAQAQLQLSQMHAYTRPTQIKNRCVAGGIARSVIRDFRIARVSDFIACWLSMVWANWLIQTVRHSINSVSKRLMVNSLAWRRRAGRVLLSCKLYYVGDFGTAGLHAGVLFSFPSSREMYNRCDARLKNSSQWTFEC